MLAPDRFVLTCAHHTHARTQSSLRWLATLVYIGAINALSMLLLSIAAGHGLLPPASLADRVDDERRTRSKYAIAGTIAFSAHVALAVGNSVRTHAHLPV
jgi:hypothetical protein